ncbi:hypothetical protein SBV1_340005 [Verrucomicrobia bacterium]|nr:hypothetical protein SBV1_340005 [Verrucomicrobiota bacterium]
MAFAVLQEDRDQTWYYYVWLSFIWIATAGSLLLLDGSMRVKFRGVADTNGSRNWEGDPNALKAAGQ